MHNPNFSVMSTLHWEEKLGEKFFAELSHAGFDAMSTGIYPGHFRNCPEDIADLKRLCRKYKMKVDLVHCDHAALDGKKQREAEGFIANDLRLTSELGARHLVVHCAIFANPDNIIRDEKGHLYPGFSVFRDLENEKTGMARKIKDGMARFAEEAKKLGVVIALETDLKMNAIMLDLISEADPEACGICFDAGHAELQMGSVKAAQLLGPRIVCTHLHDNDGKEDLHLPPFKGVIDWPGVLDALVKAEYEGYYTFECHEGTLSDIVAARERFSELISKSHRNLV